MPADCRFVYRPEQTRLAALYARCDVWLFASRQDSFGLPILEAMACRTPVLGTPTGIMPHLAPEGGGILTKMGDPASMAAAIVRVATSSTLARAGWFDMAEIERVVAAHQSGRRDHGRLIWQFFMLEKSLAKLFGI